MSGGDWSLARTLRSGETVTNEVVDVETFNGAHKTILSAVAPVLDGQGGVAGAVVVNADISPIQRAQRALRESEERLSRLFDTSPDGIAMYDRDGRIALINAEGLRMLGLTGDVMTGAQAGKAPVRQLTLTGEPYPIERHPYYHLRASGEDSYHYELMVEQADDRRIIVSAIARPLRTPEGVFDGVVVVFRDVTEEKRTQEALRASEERLARLFQATPDGITVFDREGRIELMNSAAAALFGTTAEAMLGSVAGDTPERRFTLDGEPMPPERHSFFHLRASGVSFYRYDMLLERADGSRLIVTTTACPLRTPDGDFDGVIAVHRDITERRRVLDALRESEERLQMAARSAHFGVYDDRGAGNVYWSPELRQLFGVREGEDVQGAASAAQHIHPDDYTRWEAALTHARNPAGNGEMDSEHRIIRPDGSVIWVEQKGRIFFSGEGAERRGVRAIGLVADISHRKQDEERLRLLESVVVNTTDAVLITEAEPLELPGPRIIYVNQAFTDMTGYTLEDVLGKTPRILQGPGSDRAELDRLRRALQAWESCTVELRNYRKDGTEFWVNFSILPIADETGWFTHWISVQRDVTAQHEQEERRRFLIDLTDQLRLLTDADDIIRTVTHAIGTFFGVRCCSFDEIDLAADQIVCRNDLAYGPELAQPVLPFSLFAGPEVQADLTAGRIVAAADIAADARTSGQAAEIGPLNVRATALTPLLSEGRLTALLRLTSAEPRAWSAEELELLGTVADRTWTAVERARAEAAVRQSEQRMRLALDAAPGLVYEFDIVNNTAWRSEGVERLTGWRSEEIPEDADWWAQQVHPDDVVLIQYYTSEVQSIGTYSHEYRVRHRDGRWIWVWDRAQVEFGPNGEALRSLGATIDISERKNQEVRREFLADLSEQLRQQTDPEAIMRVATHALGRFFGVGRCGFDDIDLAADRITEHTAATYGPPLSQLNVPFSGYAPATVLAELRRGRSLLINDVQRDHRFGDRRPALAALSIGAAMVVPLFHRGVLGGLLRVVTSAPREWTADEVALIQAVAERSWPLVEQARVQQALAEIDARLRLALETLQGLVYDYDIAQHTVWRSEGLERLLGWRPEEVADDPEWWNAQVHLADLVRVLTESQQTPETPVRSYEYRMRHRDGHWLWVWNVARMEFDAGGQPMRVLGVAVDISERKYAEERQRFLEDLSERLRQLTEPDDLARTATHALGAFLAVDSCAFDVFDLAGGRVMIGNDTGYGAPFPQEMVGFAEVEPPPFLAELRAGRLFASTDARTDPRFPVGQRAVQAFGMVAVVVAPLLRDGALVANLRLQVNQPRQWQPEDLDLIQTVADRAWLSIDRARAQQDLRERIEQLRQLGDNLPDGAVYQILSDRRGTSTFTYMSSGIERLTGVPAAEVLANGETLISCIGAEDQELTNAAFNRSAAELTPVDVEVRVNHRDGRLRWANLRAAPRRLADGSTVWDGVHIDITERKQAELELRASQERLQLALNAGSFGAWSWESGSQTVQWSPEVGTILGLPPERREGPLTALERITHPDDVGWVQETVRGAVARGEGFVIEPRVLLADSSEHWLYLAAQCLTDDDGRVQALVGLIADITERRRQQQHLEQLLDSEQTARRQAIEAVRLRDHVLATVTHDLKNPLAIIKGYSQVMQRLAARPGQELPASVNSGLIHIDQASAKMVAMLDELLDAARLQLGQPLVLNQKSTDLVSLVRRCVESHGNTEDTHPITVETRESELVGDWDDTRIERVVDNLLSNAIKYSPDGGAITLRLRRETAAGRIQAVLIVSDQGMGIPAADLPHVFEPFRRAGNVGTAIPGTGIGLSGAKKIVEQHGGSLTAESTEGEGSTFTLRLPLGE